MAESFTGCEAPVREDGGDKAVGPTQNAGYVSPEAFGDPFGIAPRRQSWPDHPDPTAGVRGHCANLHEPGFGDSPWRRVAQDSRAYAVAASGDSGGTRTVS